MKTIQELLAKVKDCEAEAETWTDKNKGCFPTNASNRYEGVKAGHAACYAKLGKALEEAIETLEAIAEADYRGNRSRESVVAFTNLKRIREMLESK